MVDMTTIGKLMLVCALLSGCTRGPEQVVEARPSAVPASRGAGLLRSAMMAAHNAARADVGVPPLVWDERLAASAKAYAEVLARTGRFEHADQPMGPGRQGENLFEGTRGAYAYKEMIGYWVAEKKDFVNSPTPMFSRTGRWEDVAHYTQIVWRATTAVGCATAAGGGREYLVCRYSPPGNVVGQRAF